MPQGPIALAVACLLLLGGCASTTGERPASARAETIAKDGQAINAAGDRPSRPRPTH